MSSVLRLVILETEKELKDLLTHEKSARNEQPRRKQRGIGIASADMLRSR